jgi:chromosome segregation ATPase
MDQGKDRMVEFKGLKKELSKEASALKEIDGEIERLNQKKVEFSGKLAALAADKTNAEKEQDGAVTRYAHGEITEEALDGYREAILSLEGKRKNMAAALVVVEKDLAAALERRKTCEEKQRDMDKQLWRLITDIEAAKLIPHLRRAFAAFKRAGNSDTPNIIIEHDSVAGKGKHAGVINFLEAISRRDLGSFYPDDGDILDLAQEYLK